VPENSVTVFMGPRSSRKRRALRGARAGRETRYFFATTTSSFL
jgi:hypothetical protein